MQSIITYLNSLDKYVIEINLSSKGLRTSKFIKV